VMTAAGSMTHGPVLVHAGHPRDAARGTIFPLTPGQLAHADAHEVSGCRRAEASRTSGETVGACVDAQRDNKQAGSAT